MSSNLTLFGSERDRYFGSLEMYILYITVGLDVILFDAKLVVRWRKFLLVVVCVRRTTAYVTYVGYAVDDQQINRNELMSTAENDVLVCWNDSGGHLESRHHRYRTS